jgi:hypothetical protein
VPVIKPGQNHTYNTKIEQIQKKQNIRQTKENMTGQNQYQRSTRAKSLNPERT